jgi:hypothetical protein
MLIGRIEIVQGVGVRIRNKVPKSATFGPIRQHPGFSVELKVRGSILQENKGKTPSNTKGLEVGN